jgi:rhodanese-related sulfurtransferase
MLITMNGKITRTYEGGEMDRRRIVIVFVLLTLGVLSGIAGCTQCRASTVPDSENLKAVTPKEAFELIQRNKSNPNFTILDVRTPEEFAEGHIEGAINIDYYHPGFQVELNGLDKTKTYLVYCRTGNRSGQAFEFMKEQQFREVFHMDGGITVWRKDGLPVVK